ncbi:MAG TPA: hypothetical protein VEZ42_07120 [Pseudonocardia sp.]|nr:hypothetical protein [Pseudonocardia sp.]
MVGRAAQRRTLDDAAAAVVAGGVGAVLLVALAAIGVLAGEPGRRRAAVSPAG